MAKASATSATGLLLSVVAYFIVIGGQRALSELRGVEVTQQGGAAGESFDKLMGTKKWWIGDGHSYFAVEEQGGEGCLRSGANVVDLNKISDVPMAGDRSQLSQVDAIGQFEVVQASEASSPPLYLVSAVVVSENCSSKREFVQKLIEELLLELAGYLHRATGTETIRLGVKKDGLRVSKRDPLFSQQQGESDSSPPSTAIPQRRPILKRSDSSSYYPFAHILRNLADRVEGAHLAEPTTPEETNIVILNLSFSKFNTKSQLGQ